ncbi:MAG: hypothetical protein ACTSVR_03180 [Candidatus Thorarchaeota archaeon]
MDEALKLGDCFPTVGHFAMDLKISGKPLDEWRVVHGIVVGQAEILGLKYTHAWMELGRDWQYRLVFDYSNNHDINILAQDYYSIGQIKPDMVRRYTIDEARKLMFDTGEFGPWDPLFEEYP